MFLHYGAIFLSLESRFAIADFHSLSFESLFMLFYSIKSYSSINIVTCKILIYIAI